jgi:hypothetical protein
MSATGCACETSHAGRRRLLCQADGGWNAVWVAEEVVDAADEVAFEAADRFGVGLAFSALFGDVAGGLGVVVDPGEREHVEGVV